MHNMKISHKYYVIFTLYTQLCSLNEAQGGGTRRGRSKDVEKLIENLRKISERWGFSAITSKNLVIKVK